MAYGKSTPTYPTDTVVVQINECLTRLGKTLLPGTWAVESYPLLRYIPGYFRVLQNWHAEELALFREQVSNVRQEMLREKEEALSFSPVEMDERMEKAKRHSQNSFVRYLLERQEKFELSDDELAYVAGSMFGAGADTVCFTFPFFF